MTKKPQPANIRTAVIVHCRPPLQPRRSKNQETTAANTGSANQTADHAPFLPTNGAWSAVWFALPVDRKSTRLNSSHGYISYAVFCLKKKKKHVVAHSLRHRNSLPDPLGGHLYGERHCDYRVSTGSEAGIYVRVFHGIRLRLA